MGRFDHRQTTPSRGPRDILRWRLGKKDPRHGDYAALDQVRPDIVEGGAAALAQGDPVACWIGHATYAFRLGGKLIITDPIFAKAAGVLARLTPPGIALAAMPPVDIVLVSHDHHDHYDPVSVRAMPGTALYVTGLGNADRIRKLGKPRVVELEWWHSHREGDLEITLVPARHWSMRAPWNRNSSLWGGFVVRGPEGAAYHAGDTAWGAHFAEIGARLGRIDWAMLPIGGFQPRWFMESQHIGPDEAGRAFLAMNARNFLAMHWGTFRMTDEAVGEPPARLREWWAEHGLPPDRLWIFHHGEARPL